MGAKPVWAAWRLGRFAWGGKVERDITRRILDLHGCAPRWIIGAGGVWHRVIGRLFRLTCRDSDPQYASYDFYGTKLSE